MLLQGPYPGVSARGAAGAWSTSCWQAASPPGWARASGRAQCEGGGDHLTKHNNL